MAAPSPTTPNMAQLMQMLLESQVESQKQNQRLEEAHRQLRERDQRPPIVASSTGTPDSPVLQHPSLNTAQITHLKDESNYEDWRDDWGDQLHELGLRSYVQEDVKRPDTPQEAAVWEQERSSVYTALFRTTTRTAKNRLRQNGYDDDPEDRNPYKLWQAAKETFWELDTMGMLTVWQRLCSIRRSTFRDTHAFLNEFGHLRARIQAAMEVSDMSIAFFLLIAIQESHPDIVTEYTVMEKELTFKALLKDVNKLQAIEKSHISSGSVSIDPPAPQPQNNNNNINTMTDNKNKGARKTKEPPPHCDWCEDYHWVAEGNCCWKVFPEHVPASHRNVEGAKKHAEAWLLTEKGKKLRERAYKKLGIVDPRAPTPSMLAYNMVPQPPIADLWAGTPAAGYGPSTAW